MLRGSRARLGSRNGPERTVHRGPRPAPGNCGDLAFASANSWARHEKAASGRLGPGARWFALIRGRRGRKRGGGGGVRGRACGARGRRRRRWARAWAAGPAVPVAGAHTGRAGSNSRLRTIRPAAVPGEGRSSSMLFVRVTRGRLRDSALPWAGSQEDRAEAARRGGLGGGGGGARRCSRGARRRVDCSRAASGGFAGGTAAFFFGVGGNGGGRSVRRPAWAGRAAQTRAEGLPTATVAPFGR